MMSVAEFIYKPNRESLLRVALWILIIIQSCGIRFFDGQGSVLMGISILFTIPFIKYVTYKDINTLLGLAGFLLLVMWVNNSFDFSKALFQYGLIIQSYLFLMTYRTRDANDLVIDFYRALSLIFLHSSIGYILYMIVPFIFSTQSTLAYSYESALGVFFISHKIGSFPRNTGILWEPGLLQLMLNIFLFYSIKFKKESIKLLFIAIMIVSTLSTVGFFILFLNLFYYVINRSKNALNAIAYVTGGLTFISLFYGLFASNILDKLGGENTSGLIRYRDFSIGINLIKESPLLGHGLFESDYLLSKPYVNFIEAQLFSLDFLDVSGNLAGGFTNGLLGIFCWYGIPMGLVAYYCLFNNALVEDRKSEKVIFFSILILTFISEPITFTSFFLIFPLSHLVLTKYIIQPKWDTILTKS